MAIIDDVKELLEIDTTSYDNQLLLVVNSGISYLINNDIPLVNISLSDDKSVFTDLNTQDYYLVLEYLQLHTMQNFDLTTGQLYDRQMLIKTAIRHRSQALLYQLRILYNAYDSGV